MLLIALGTVSLVSGADSLRLGMLPWTGATLTRVVFFAGVLGLITVVLAIAGKLRPLFFAWALAVAVIVVKGYVFTGYRLQPGEARLALYLIGASLLALPGAWFHMWRKPRRTARY